MLPVEELENKILFAIKDATAGIRTQDLAMQVEPCAGNVMARC
jgi:hypothetical protein